MIFNVFSLLLYSNVRYKSSQVVCISFPSEVRGRTSAAEAFWWYYEPRKCVWCLVECPACRLNPPVLIQLRHKVTAVTLFIESAETKSWKSRYMYFAGSTVFRPFAGAIIDGAMPDCTKSTVNNVDRRSSKWFKCAVKSRGAQCQDILCKNMPSFETPLISRYGAVCYCEDPANKYVFQWYACRFLQSVIQNLFSQFKIRGLSKICNDLYIGLLTFGMLKVNTT